MHVLKSLLVKISLIILLWCTIIIRTYNLKFLIFYCASCFTQQLLNTHYLHKYFEPVFSGKEN